MFTFLLVVQAIIATALVTVILMQRSEGGGLTGGGSPAGLMSARGAANFMTRATTILATLFVICCIALATLASLNNRTGTIDASEATPAQTAPGPVTAPVQAPVVDPLAAAAGQATGNASNGAAPAHK